MKTQWKSLAICLLVTAIPLAGHYDPMVEISKPAPPPVVDPGPDAALLRVRVKDAISGERLSAVVSVNQGAQEPAPDPYSIFSLRRSGNRMKGPVRFRPLNYYFYTDGAFEVRVPPGHCTLELRKGYEFVPCIVSLEAEPRDTLEVQAVLERWIDMSALGWYSGDTHIHMRRTGVNDDTLLNVTSAKDIRYAYLVSVDRDKFYRETGNDSRGQTGEFGDSAAACRGDYWLSPGQEYISDSLGHVTIHLLNGFVHAEKTSKDTGGEPSLAVIADQVHALHGFIGLAHGGYSNQEADGLLLAGKMDFLELLQFGGYRSQGLEGWYDILNLGYRLPIVGACDFPATRELGSEITYVRSEVPLTPRTWIEAAVGGRSFVTSGPMLFLEVGSARPGDILEMRENVDTLIQVDVKVRSNLYPVRYIELIVNGVVISREMNQELLSPLDLKYVLPVRESVWIAARAYSEAGTESHTNPVYVYAGGKPPFIHDSARNVLARLDGSIKTIRNADVLARLKKLKKNLQTRLETAP